MTRLSTPTISTRALVLRARALGEKDRALTLLCEDGHKLQAVARGARGAKSKLSAVAQPFVRARLLLARGKTFAVVSQAEIETAHPRLATEFSRATWAAYCCELCDALPEELPETDAFTLLDIGLDALDSCDLEGLELVGRWFEAKFLALQGYGAQLGRCQKCNAKIVVGADESARTIAFSPSGGGTLCAGCRMSDGNRLEVRADALRLLHRLERAPAPLADEVLDATRRDLKLVLRASLRAHLGLRLKSQRFLEE